MILKVEFAQLPAAGGETVARPAADIAINGVDEAPLRCLIDTGAFKMRLPGSVAPDVGVDLTGITPGEPLVIGGTRTIPHDVEVSLACAGHEWQATVSFCSPDFAGFGLAGLRGFFDQIYVGIDGYLGLVELEPHNDRLERLGLDSHGRPIA
jgi:hypothetical protein